MCEDFLEKMTPNTVSNRVSKQGSQTTASFPSCTAKKKNVGSAIVGGFSRSPFPHSFLP